MTVLSSSQPSSGAFTVRAAAVLIVLLFLLFISVLTWSILREQRDAQRRAEDRADAASQVVATNARWISELSRQALSRIDEALGTDIDANAETTGALIREAVADLPGNVKAYVVAADGHTVFSTDKEVKPIDIRDREYFSALANGKFWYVSPLLVSRLDGAQIFVFSKRIARSGGFAGAAIISFDVAILEEIWRALGMDRLSTVSLIRDDGQLIGRFPLADGPLDLSDYVLFTDYLKKAPTGTYSAHSPADGVTRIVGYRRVPGTGIIAVASVSTDSAFAVFRRNTFNTLLFALPTALALALATGWILRLLRADEARRGQLHDALNHNRMLVRDTHHRVKNNLQSIMSLVRMHPLPTQLKLDLQSRISAMSAVHEHLYRLDQFSEIDATTLIPAIIEPLRAGFDHPATITYDIDALVLDRDHATPLALVVNEVVTNCLKYAFPHVAEGRIEIAFKHLDGGPVTLRISDNGVGFDASVPSTGLGSRLIRAMVTQLGGTSSYTFEHGTVFEATLPPQILSSDQGQVVRKAS